MFGIFESEGKKKVKQWKKEHRQLVDLAQKIEEAYRKGNTQKAKNYLGKLKNAGLQHLMHEDVAFFQLKEKKKTKELEQTVDSFQQSFGGTKLALMDFLLHYAKEETVLDETFIREFEALVKVLAERIDFEENYFYPMIEKL